MALGEWCGKSCSECENPCALDEMISCSPDCANLTVDGKINIKGCLVAKCETVKYVFDVVGCSDEEILSKFGEMTVYPY